MASGQLGVIESVLINFCGYERLSLMFNMVVFLLVLLVFSIVRLMPHAQEWVFIIYAVPFVLGVINILRLFLVSKDGAALFCDRPLALPRRYSGTQYSFSRRLSPLFQAFNR
ncbi:hypothetical protein DK37_15075 [Halomonas sp. SUBG004]|nr:hypothetical protein DK37_15075 [Halomonas sp. SUBG004]